MSSTGARSLKVIPTVIVLALTVFLLNLGRWQLNRMHEKQTLFAEFAAGGHQTLPLSAGRSGQDMRYQHVSASGHYENAHQVLLDNMTHEGQAGYRVLTPFETSTGDTLLVDRGWVPAGATRVQLPDIRVGEEARDIRGRLDNLPGRGIDLAAAPATGWPRVLTYPKMDVLTQAFGRPLFPYILLLDKDQPEGYVRDWRPSTFPPERHLAYAITWFALAATLLILSAYAFLRRSPENS